MIRKTLLAAAAVVALAGNGPSPAHAPSFALGRLAKLGTIDARYQAYNIEMVKVTGGRFWAPYGGPANERYRQRPPIDLADPRLVALARAPGLAPDGTLTGLDGTPVAGRVAIPGHGIAFYAVPGAGNPACC